MNIEERAAQAAAWKATGQCNCAQAVMKVFEDKLPVDADTLMKLGWWRASSPTARVHPAFPRNCCKTFRKSAVLPSARI